MTGDDALAEQVKRDYSKAPLEPRERVLMDWAVKVTRHPEVLSSGDVDELREAGWTDEQILTAAEVVGFFNYYARMADALGVDPEDFMRPTGDGGDAEGGTEGENEESSDGEDG